MSSRVSNVLVEATKLARCRPYAFFLRSPAEPLPQNGLDVIWSTPGGLLAALAQLCLRAPNSGRVRPVTLPHRGFRLATPAHISDAAGCFRKINHLLDRCSVSDASHSGGQFQAGVEPLAMAVQVSKSVVQRSLKIATTRNGNDNFQRERRPYGKSLKALCWHDGASDLDRAFHADRLDEVDVRLSAHACTACVWRRRSLWDGVGRVTDFGHAAPSGQFSSNQRSEALKRPTVMSAPALIAASFLLSPNTRCDSVTSLRSVADMNASARQMRCDNWVITCYRLYYRCRQRFSYRSQQIHPSGNFTA